MAGATEQADLRIMKELVLVFTLLIGAVLFSGCATHTVHQQVPVVRAPPALTPTQVKEMTAKRVSDETILSALRASRAVYWLTADEVRDLQEARVSYVVIDYMLSTPQLFPPTPIADRYYYYPAYPYPYWAYDWHWTWGWHHGGHHGWHH